VAPSASTSPRRRHPRSLRRLTTSSGSSAEIVRGAEEALEVFSRRSLGHGGRAWTLDDVRGDSGMRLYRAVSEAHSMPAKDGQPDHRVPVGLG